MTRQRSKALRFLAVASVGAVLAACAAHMLQTRESDVALPRAAQPVGVIGLTATPIPLDARNPTANRVGQLTYLWGLHLTSDSTSRFGGLSGLEVERWAPPVATAGQAEADYLRLQFTAVTDEGDILQWRAPVTDGGRFQVLPATLAPLRDLSGRPLQTKREADAEDLSLDGQGGYLVSFERNHRIWRYSDQVGALSDLRPTPLAAWPREPLPENDGFESVAVYTRQAGSGPSVMVGAEDGRVWNCATACTPVLPTGGPDGFKLTGLDQLPGTDDLVAVYRAFDPIRGMRAIVARIRPDASAHRRIEVLARLSPPLSVDNMEGVAAQPNGRGGFTLWLLSDNNFSASQRTLLLAFDYTPPS